MNKANYRGKEPASHRRARLKAERWLVEDGYVLMGADTITLMTEFGKRDYTPDIPAFYPFYSLQFIVELDGHSHAGRTVQDDNRDRAFENIGRPTIRFTVEDLDGFKLPHGGRSPGVSKEWFLSVVRERLIRWIRARESNARIKQM